jgi:uncharacterized protein YhaN
MEKYIFQLTNVDKKIIENNNIRKILIANKEKINDIHQQIPFITEKIKEYYNLNENTLKEKNQLKNNILELNAIGKTDFSKILNLKLDNLTFEELSKSIKLYEEKQRDKKVWERERNKSYNEIQSFATQKREQKLQIKEYSFIRYFYICIAILIMGIGLTFANLLVGIAVILFSTIFGITFILIKSKSINDAKKECTIIKEKLNKENINYKNIEDQIEVLNKEIQIYMNNLENFRLMYDLKNDIDYSYLINHFINLRELKKKVTDYYSKKENVDNLKIVLEEKLKDIIYYFYEEELIDSLEIKEDYLCHNKKIIQYICDFQDQCIKADKLENLIGIKNSIEKDIKNLIDDEEVQVDYLLYLEKYISNCEQNEIIATKEKEYSLKLNSFSAILNTKKIKRILLGNSFSESEENILMNKFKEEINNYISKEEMEKDFSCIEQKLFIEERNLENLIVEKGKVALKLEALNTVEIFESSQNTIDEARKELFPLVRKYAIYKAAIVILTKLQNNFMEKTKDTLLSGASKYLNMLTSGEIKQILPHEDIMQYDFVTQNSEGEYFNNSNILSRATKEQLFLSVRLNRIKDIRPHFPVVFDDSFVNFDEKSLHNTANIINELSKTNQIFILTCHSRVVNFILNTNENVRYLSLEKGRFSEVGGEDLKNYLGRV